MSLQATAHIAVVGEFDPSKIAHQAIPHALALAAAQIGGIVEHEWISTDDLSDHIEARLAPFDGIWCAPGSPYASMDGALNAIRFAREHDRAYLGTCGGYQHALIEYARNKLGLIDADHAESNPNTHTPLIAALQCALIEQRAAVTFKADSKLGALFQGETLIGEYHCSYGLNPQFASLFENGAMQIAARNSTGEAQAFVLDHHRFFVGVAFQPERGALRNELSPIIATFVRASQEHHA